MKRLFALLIPVASGLITSCGTVTAQDQNINEEAPGSDQIRPMLSEAWVPENTHTIRFDQLPKVPLRHVVVNDVRPLGGHRINQHNYLIYYRNRYWIMWSDGPGLPITSPEKHANVVPKHDQAGQRVYFSTSKNGLKWEKPKELTTIPDKGFGWIARGFWLYEGKLLALASRYHAPGFSGEGLQLHAFELASARSDNWAHAGLVYDDALNNFPPQKIPSGEWMMSRRDHRRHVYFLVGGKESYQSWESFKIAGYDKKKEFVAEEPYWWVLPDGTLQALFRDNQESGFLYRSFSENMGRTWTTPQKTNFPDATSKFSGLRMRDGRYVLVSNPDPHKRDPLTISISDDGISFHTMIYLIGGRHVDYPHVMENNGCLFIAFSGAKQTVEVLRIRISDLSRIDRATNTLWKVKEMKKTPIK